MMARLSLQLEFQLDVTEGPNKDPEMDQLSFEENPDGESLDH